MCNAGKALITLGFVLLLFAFACLIGSAVLGMSDNPVPSVVLGIFFIVLIIASVFCWIVGGIMVSSCPPAAGASSLFGGAQGSLLQLLLFRLFTRFPSPFPDPASFSGLDWVALLDCLQRSGSCGCREGGRDPFPRNPDDVLKEALAFIRRGQRVLEDARSQTEQDLRDLEAWAKQQKETGSAKIEEARNQAEEALNSLQESVDSTSATAGAILSRLA